MRCRNDVLQAFEKRDVISLCLFMYTTKKVYQQSFLIIVSQSNNFSPTISLRYRNAGLRSLNGAASWGYYLPEKEKWTRRTSPERYRRLGLHDRKNIGGEQLAKSVSDGRTEYLGQLVFVAATFVSKFRYCLILPQIGPSQNKALSLKIFTHCGICILECPIFWTAFCFFDIIGELMTVSLFLRIACGFKGLMVIVFHLSADSYLQPGPDISHHAGLDW
ncbi:hypothetical protein KCU89_g32, partial [Aureobasidium melanogenum]